MTGAEGRIAYGKVITYDTVSGRVIKITKKHPLWRWNKFWGVPTSKVLWNSCIAMKEEVERLQKKRL